MINSEKRLEQLAKILDNSDTIITTEAIQLLRDERPFKGAIGLLTSYYNNTTDRSVRKAIEEFLNDIKEQEAAAEVINEIKKQWKPETISMLVASCWQSGLDYSEHIVFLTQVFMNGDYVTAIECLTVIQESLPELSSEKKNEIREILMNNPVTSRNEKAELFTEILSILGN